MSNYGFDTINEQTGFAQGEMFASEDQVREYFTVVNIRAMFGAGDTQDTEQGMLDEMAAEVIANGWHCAF